MSALLTQPQALVLAAGELGGSKLEQRTEAEGLIHCSLTDSRMMLSVFLQQCEWALDWSQTEVRFENKISGGIALPAGVLNKIFSSRHPPFQLPCAGPGLSPVVSVIWTKGLDSTVLCTC